MKVCLIILLSPPPSHTTPCWVKELNFSCAVPTFFVGKPQIQSQLVVPSRPVRPIQSFHEKWILRDFNSSYLTLSRFLHWSPTSSRSTLGLDVGAQALDCEATHLSVLLLMKVLFPYPYTKRSVV